MSARPVLACLALLLSSCATTAERADGTGGAPKCHLRYVEAHSRDPGAPPTEMIVAAMQNVRSDVRGCYDRYRQQGTVMTCIDVAANGIIELVDSEGDLLGTDQVQCIKSAVQSVKFAPHDTPWSFKYPYVFR